MAHISVVIPVFESEECLHELYRRLLLSLEAVSSDFEMILVEDGGKDRSWDIVRELSKKDPRVKGLRFSRNFGQHYGITAGLDYCDADWVVVMDCDLQDRPEDIPRLYQKAAEGYEIVLAKRVHRNDNPSKILGSRLFYKLFSYLSGIEYDRDVGNFRMLSRKVVKNLRPMRERLRFFGGLVQWLGFSVASIEVEHDARYKGKTTYTFKRLFKLATDAIIDYSDRPLKISIKFGFTMSGIAFLCGMYLLGRSLIFRSPVMGWSSLIVSLYFLGGIIIGILGVLGVYLGQTFNETKRRPLYVIADSTFPCE